MALIREPKDTFQALDIVRTPGGGIAMVTETLNGGKQCSINYIGDLNPKDEHNAWWREGDGLVLLDSIPRLLAEATHNQFGDGKIDARKFFGDIVSDKFLECTPALHSKE
jgi:hypothetical protein